jgi:hypothetical protein
LIPAFDHDETSALRAENVELRRLDDERRPKRSSGRKRLEERIDLNSFEPEAPSLSGTTGQVTRQAALTARA